MMRPRRLFVVLSYPPNWSVGTTYDADTGEPLSIPYASIPRLRRSYVEHKPVRIIVNERGERGEFIVVGDRIATRMEWVEVVAVGSAYAQAQYQEGPGRALVLS